jgi:hypothetical protein
MKSISLIIGSGFSIPDGMRSVNQINQILKNLKEIDIYIHSDMTFILLNGQEKPTFSIHSGDEKFFIQFIDWYINLSKGEFNYEIFYDYITSFKRFGNHKNDIEPFFEEFKRDILKSDSPLDGINSYVSRFSEYFNQLVSNLLQSQKYYENVGLGNYPPYDRFSTFLKEMVSGGFIVNCHSLNHDLLFEHLASKHSELFQDFTDGFTDLGSPYFGNVHLQQSISKSYKVRLKYFTNTFNKPIRLYKLHGSVDTYIANIGNPNLDLTRVKKDWGVGEIQKEIKLGNGELGYSELFQNTYPDILSGASSKAIWYQQPYYKEIHEHFARNLINAELLVVIGYGFGDDGINHIIESNYLTKGKRMIIIDIKKPESRLIDDYRTTILEKSLSNVSMDEWIKIKKIAIEMTISKSLKKIIN